MKSKLDLLEQYLQKFIESSADLLWHDERLDMVRKLISAIKTEMDQDLDTGVDLPAAFSIFLSPYKYTLWHTDKDLLEGFSAALQEAAVEIGLRTYTRPVIFLEMARDLAKDDLQVQIIHTEKTAAKTAIFSPENPDNIKKATRHVKAFLILENGVHFQLKKSVINIGRREENELVIDDPHVSREHAQIRLVQDSYFLFDLNSTGGTFVNGRKIEQSTLQTGDVISLANHPFIYVEEDQKPHNPVEKHGSITHTTRIVTDYEEDKEDK